MAFLARPSENTVQDIHRLCHDIWLNDDFTPTQMGKLRVTADKVLHFKIEETSVPIVEKDVGTIENRRVEAGLLREAIRAVLPTLPQMSLTELYPIVESL